MINVTPAAREQILAYFADKQIQPVRIFLSSGCGGPQLAMALDEKTDKDGAYEYEGIQYVMDQELLDQAQPVIVDYSGTGFKLESKLELSSGCSSCGTKGSCCS